MVGRGSRIKVQGRRTRKRGFCRPLHAPSDTDSFSFQPTSNVQRHHLPPITTDSEHFFVIIHLSDVLETYKLKSFGPCVTFFRFRRNLVQTNESDESDGKNRKAVMMIFYRGRFLGVGVEETSSSSSSSSLWKPCTSISCTHIEVTTRNWR